MDRSPLILIAGLPGAGKTTVARRVAEAFDPSLHLQVDGIRSMMVRGSIAPDQADGWSDALARQFLRESRAASALAACYREDGVAVVVDDVAIPPMLERCYVDIPSMHKVLLLPSLEVLLQRLKHRGDIYDALFTEQVPMLHAMLASLDKPGWTVLDTSEQSADETVSAVMQSLPSRGSTQSS